MGWAELRLEKGGLLIDTCVLIWWASKPEELSQSAVDALSSPDCDIYWSSITVAEVARLAEKKRIEIPEHWKPWLKRVLAELGWSEIPPSSRIMEEAHSLPGDFHGDPADRILTATARLNGLSLVTPDRLIRTYPHVDTLW